ncbi:MAG TPA: S9 family peptidase [Candidatus Baltobacteraceae bacterium]|nr:S9 family peptidase [Candidatus Baltobacteraceae bacterium]
MLIRRCALTLAALAAAVPAVVAAATLGENDFRHLVTLSSPAISPDGKRAVVVVRRVVWDEDRRDEDLVMIDLATHATRTLTYRREDLSGPAFSPDGTQLAFIAQDEANEKDQIFVMPLDGGDARPVTHGKTDVEEFTWRPDGRAFAYVATDPEPERKGADRFRDSFIFTTEPITARSRPRPLHLFVQPAGGGASRQLTFGPQSATSDYSLSWSPDGKTIAITLVPNEILNDESYSHVALVDVETKTVRGLTGRTEWESSPLFSPDGKHVAYTYSTGDPQVTLVQLYVTTPEGGKETAVSGKIDGDVTDYSWSHDSKSVLIASPDRTTMAIYRLPLDGAPEALDLHGTIPGTPGQTTGAVTVSSLESGVASDGTMVFVGSSPKQPPEIYERATDGAVTKLTDFNAALARFDFGSAERITFPTSMGITGDGVVYYPPGFTAGHKYPLSVYVHGGPDDPTALGFDFWAQVMASHGWVVLRPNYRGSPNLGLAYKRAILYDPQEGPGKDIVAAIDALRARGIVDESRIAVSGWSYGGIMTAWMISKFHFWKAAVSGASVNDWITDYGTADDSMADRDMLHGSPFVGNNAAEWRRVSPISYVRDVTTPVLILSDIGDNRDPFATSSMYWRALRDNGKDATLRTWPINGHFPNDPVRVVDVYHYWLDFIDQRFSR